MKFKNTLMLALVAIAFYGGWLFNQQSGVSGITEARDTNPTLQAKAEKTGYVAAMQIRNQDPALFACGRSASSEASVLGRYPSALQLLYGCLYLW